MTGTSRAGDRPVGRKWLMFAIGLVALLAGIVAGLSANRAIWEGWVIDRLFQIRAILRSDEALAPAPVAVVGLDQTALNADRFAAIPRVFMTPVFAKAGQALLDAGAVAIGFDFVFAFSADAFTDPNTGEARLAGLDRPFLQFLYQNRGKVFVARTSTGRPHRAISAAAGTSGTRLAEVTPDSDGVVRRHETGLPLGDSPLFIDALLFSAGLDEPAPYVAVPEFRLATSLPYFSLLDIIALTETDDGKAHLRGFADGRVVLFGSTLPNEDEHVYSDRFLPSAAPGVALTGESGRPATRYQTAGVYVLADLIGAAMSGRAAIAPPFGTRTTLAIGFALAGAVAGLLIPLALLPVVALATLTAGLGVSLGGLEFGYIIAPGVAPVAGLTGMIVAALGKIGVLQRRERALVRLFGHYLSPDVIRHMAAAEKLPDLGGETRYVVVAFIDIVGFTKMSEKLPDQDVVRVVNQCFDAIGATITKHHGYIDKYIGDAIMAVWNAPNAVEAPEQAAVDAAIEIIASLDSIRARTGQLQLDLRVALNSGPVLVGDIGGEHRRSFTVMGTTVNTASRVESVAKNQNVRLAASASVAEQLPASYPIKQIWTGRLRGLSLDTTVYTLDQPDMFMATDAAPSVSQSLDRAQVIKLPR